MNSTSGLPKFTLKLTHLSTGHSVHPFGANSGGGCGFKEYPLDEALPIMPSRRGYHDLASPFTQFYYCGRQSRECDINKV